MSWFADWNTRRTKVAWQYATKGFLWRLVPSATGHLVIEDRDVERKTVAFTCLDRLTGRVLWKNVEFNEKWWVTIDTIHDDVLFLHEYATPDMPEQKKIFAVDVRSGNLRWSNDEMKMLIVHEDHVYACKDGITDRLFYDLDLKTGEMRREVDEHVVDVLRESAPKNPLEFLRFPKVYHNEFEEKALEGFVNRATANSGNVTLIEYLEVGSRVMIGFCENSSVNPTQQTLRQHVTVLHRKSGRILFSDIVAENVVMAVPETFFAIESCVYYIKNRTTLRALNLSKN